MYRTPGFTTLLQNLQHTATFFHNPTSVPSATADDPAGITSSHLVKVETQSLLDAPLMSSNPSPENPNSELTAAQQITSLLTTTGENITLRRAAVFAPPTVETHEGLFYPAFFAHTPSGVPANLGSPAAFLVLHLTGPGTVSPTPELLKDTESLGRLLARQMVGVPSKQIYSFVGGDGRDDAVVEGSEVLMEQHFMFYSGEEAQGGEKSVGQILAAWGEKRNVRVRVEGAERWVVGQGSEVGQEET